MFILLVASFGLVGSHSKEVHSERTEIKHNNVENKASITAEEPEVVKANFVFTNGKVYTVNPKQEWAKAVAVTSKNISYVGGDEGAKAYIGPDTKVIDLECKFVMPGIVCTHEHPLMLMAIKSALNLEYIGDKAKMLASVKEYVENKPDAPMWSFGGSYEGRFDMFKEDIDEIILTYNYDQNNRKGKHPDIKAYVEKEQDLYFLQEPKVQYRELYLICFQLCCLYWPLSRLLLPKINPHPSLMDQNFADQALVLKEILDAGAIPMAIRGDHGTQVATIMAVVDHYGPKNVVFVYFDAYTDLAGPGKKRVGFLHFDAHLDRGTGKFGAYFHSGSYMNMAVEEDLLDCKHLVQFGMSTPVFGEYLYDQILSEGGHVYHLHEILRDGVDVTFDNIYKDLKDVDLLYVSFDIDVFDMSCAPGTDSSSPTGMSLRELFPQLRELAATKTLVGFDIVECNPFYDNRGQQTARLARRIMLEFLTGIAMKKKGMDPKYVNPRISGKP